MAMATLSVVIMSIALLGWFAPPACAVVPGPMPHPIVTPSLLEPLYDQDFDAVSLVSVGTPELKRGMVGAATAKGHLPPHDDDDTPALESTRWEERFSVGEQMSRQFTDAVEEQHSSWVHDTLSGGAVPAPIAEAEKLLVASEDATPEAIWKEKTAVRSLRLYHHAKWLAERGHARAAESRFHSATELAKRSRRSVLASHSLGRLGYFLLQWRRLDEAKEALTEAERLNSKSNPLATYLLGVLLRRDAGSDIVALQAAEARILSVGTQPSEELEVERMQHVEDIKFWRMAEGDAMQCLASNNVAHMLICVFGHMGLHVRRALVGDAESAETATASS